MSRISQPFLALLLAALAAGAGVASGAPEAVVRAGQSRAKTGGGNREWSLYKFEGRDYVSLENVGRFYQFGKLQRNGNNVALRTPNRYLRGQVGSPDFYINNLKFILSFPVVELAGRPCISRMDLTKLIEPILRPSRIQNNTRVDTIILDAGHGGHDTGAASLFGREKTYTLDVALRARALLRAAGFRVFLTRRDDTFIPLEERAALGRRYPNALFISIHFNAGGPDATGVETFTLAPRGVPSMAADGPAFSDYLACTGNSRDAENIALACATHATMVLETGLFDRGIKRARFVVLRESSVPGVLIEGGFLTNPADARLIHTPAYRQKLAASIVRAIRNYRASVGPRSAPMPAPVAPPRPPLEDEPDESSASQEATETPAGENVPRVVTSTSGAATKPKPAATPAPTATPTATPMPSPSATPAATPTSAEATAPAAPATPSPTTPSSSPTPEPTPAAPSPTPTAKPSPKPTPSAIAKPSPTAKPSPKAAPAAKPKPSATAKPSPASSPKPTVEPTATPAPSPTPKPKKPWKIR